MPDELAALMDANRRNWDDRAAIHLRNATGFYAIDHLRAGGDVLHPIEGNEIGDVAGRRLVHLQCHFGLDTLSLARRGAIVTGLDFSGTAVAGARALAAETGLAATFVEGNVYDAPRLLTGPFDVAFVTWGAINWLPDIARWARVVSDLLTPGGRLYLAEAHPSTLILEEVEEHLEPRYAWRTGREKPIATDEAITYTGDETKLANARAYEWIHPLSAIIGGLGAAGLRLDFLHEHELLPYRLFPMMVEAGGRLYRLPDGHVPMPLSFSLQASKPG